VWRERFAVIWLAGLSLVGVLCLRLPLCWRAVRSSAFAVSLGGWSHPFVLRCATPIRLFVSADPALLSVCITSGGCQPYLFPWFGPRLWQIPPCFHSSPKLQRLDIGSNQLTGSVPPFTRLQNLVLRSECGFRPPALFDALCLWCLRCRDLCAPCRSLRTACLVSPASCWSPLARLTVAVCVRCGQLQQAARHRSLGAGLLGTFPACCYPVLVIGWLHATVRKRPCAFRISLFCMCSFRAVVRHRSVVAPGAAR
jgi:hypothetical protein